MAKKLARGFKAEAERLAVAVRQVMGLGTLQRLDPLQLADYQGIAAVSVSGLLDLDAERGIISRRPSANATFSAMIVCLGKDRLIVYNERHPPSRRANSLAHEVSHVLLGHPPEPGDFEDGQRYWDARMEREADWLAAALLVPREGALQWLLNGGDMAGGANNFGVSFDLFQWRANQTGVVHQLRAMAAM